MPNERLTPACSSIFPLPAAGQEENLSPTPGWTSSGWVINPHQTQPWALTWPWFFQTLKLDSNLGTYVKDRISRHDKVRGPRRRVGRHSAATSFAGFPRPHLQHWFICEKNNSLFNIGHNIMTYNPQCFFFFFHVFNPLSCSFWEH